jgi:hypothetical protein
LGFDSRGGYAAGFVNAPSRSLWSRVWVWRIPQSGRFITWAGCRRVVIQAQSVYEDYSVLATNVDPAGAASTYASRRFRLISPARLAASIWDGVLCSSLTVYVPLTAGCIDTDLPAGRGYSGQSGKPLIEIAHVHHAVWVMFTETHCKVLLAATAPRIRGDARRPVPRASRRARRSPGEPPCRPRRRRASRGSLAKLGKLRALSAKQPSPPWALRAALSLRAARRRPPAPFAAS